MNHELPEWLRWLVNFVVIFGLLGTFPTIVLIGLWQNRNRKGH